MEIDTTLTAAPSKSSKLHSSTRIHTKDNVTTITAVMMRALDVNMHIDDIWHINIHIPLFLSRHYVLVLNLFPVNRNAPILSEFMAIDFYRALDANSSSELDTSMLKRHFFSV